MFRNGRLIIIGLDGVPYGLISGLAKENIMPNMGGIIRDGVFRQMSSSIPEVSSVAWSSIITGKNPAEHGIFGFTDFPHGTYRLSFSNFKDLKAPVFWNDPPKPSVIINVPSTYPALPLNGVLISGFVAPDLEKGVYPSSFVPYLKENDYRIDVDSGKAHKSFDLFLNDLDKTLDSRKKIYEYLWKKEKWQIFMLVFTGTDRLMHFLWEAYEDKSHKYHTHFTEHFKKIDGIIGEIVKKCGDNDSIIFLSDHGFEKLEKDVNINFLLKKEGFLKFTPGEKENFSSIDYQTKAFALDPARIYINLKDKYPRGKVEQKEKDKIIEDLKVLFASLEYNGKKVIKKLFRKEEIYSGPLLEHAP
ncbi:MAG: alkaline phosphatase family protein, partial [Candidatus Ratteibacteria bacterium]|nr:alkaline phosphatase family protein [Candidatus Ratteibacteria bacterium]